MTSEGSGTVLVVMRSSVIKSLPEEAWHRRQL